VLFATRDEKQHRKRKAKKTYKMGRYCSINSKSSSFLVDGDNGYNPFDEQLLLIILSSSYLNLIDRGKERKKLGRRA
jgi:ribosomal protein S4E